MPPRGSLRRHPAATCLFQSRIGIRRLNGVLSVPDKRLSISCFTRGLSFHLLWITINQMIMDGMINTLLDELAGIRTPHLSRYLTSIFSDYCSSPHSIHNHLYKLYSSTQLLCNLYNIVYRSSLRTSRRVSHTLRHSVTRGSGTQHELCRLDSNF